MDGRLVPRSRSYGETDYSVVIADLVRGEACGHCCTCRWWDMNGNLSVDADLHWRYDGVCRIRSSPQPERSECDWCGEYEFFGDHE